MTTPRKISDDLKVSYIKNNSKKIKNLTWEEFQGKSLLLSKPISSASDAKKICESLQSKEIEINRKAFFVIPSPTATSDMVFRIMVDLNKIQQIPELKAQVAISPKQESKGILHRVSTFLTPSFSSSSSSSSSSGPKPPVRKDVDSDASTKKSTLPSTPPTPLSTTISQRLESKLPINEDPTASQQQEIPESKTTFSLEELKRIAKFLSLFHPAVVKQTAAKGKIADSFNSLWYVIDDNKVGMHCPGGRFSRRDMISMFDIQDALCTQFSQKAKDVGFDQTSIEMFNKLLRTSSSNLGGIIWLEDPAILNHILKLADRKFRNYAGLAAVGVFSKLPKDVNLVVLDKFISLGDASRLSRVNKAAATKVKEGRALDAKKEMEPKKLKR